MTLADRVSQYETAKADLRHIRELLYRAIRRDRKKGKTVPELAKETGLTVSRINQIIAEGKE